MDMCPFVRIYDVDCHDARLLSLTGPSSAMPLDSAHDAALVMNVGPTRFLTAEYTPRRLYAIHALRTSRGVEGYIMGKSHREFSAQCLLRIDFFTPTQRHAQPSRSTMLTRTIIALSTLTGLAFAS